MTRDGYRLPAGDVSLDLLAELAAPDSTMTPLPCIHHKQRRSRRWCLEPGRQTLLALAHLHNGDTYTGAAGFEIGVATAWRCVHEAMALLISAAEDLDSAKRRIRLLAYAILHGTLTPIDRVAEQKPYFCGKHNRHGGERAGHRGRRRPAGVGIIGTARLGSAHDLTPTAHDIIDALSSADV